MKCKYCGGDVTLDDHFCPNCGRAVDQAQRHQREMQEYETEFEETKKAAMDKIAVSSGGGTAVGIRLGVIVALIAALIWMAVNLNVYTVNERREAKAAKKNYDAYVEQIEQYLEDRDYMALGAFADKHKLDYSQDFKQYREIFTLNLYFKSVYRGLLETAYLTEDTRDLYYAENLSKNINNFYDQLLSDSVARLAKDPERTEAVYMEMEEELTVLLQRYLGLTKEETDSLRELSKSRRTVLIEQALDQLVVSVTGVGLSDMNKVELPELEPVREDK